MSLILPGYPPDNPILAGIAAIAGGVDPETAIARRDYELSTPREFANAALNACVWFPDGSPLLENMLRQAMTAFNRAGRAHQSQLLEQAEKLERDGHPAAIMLASGWRALMEP